VTIDPQNLLGRLDRGVQASDAEQDPEAVRGRVPKMIAEKRRPADPPVSQSGAADGNVGDQRSRSVLQQLAGKSSTIAMTLQSTTDEPTQITVECDFQSLGDCARHRFTVTREKSDALLQVKFDRSLAPNSPGTLTINSDLDGKARGINLLRRAHPALPMASSAIATGYFSQKPESRPRADDLVVDRAERVLVLAVIIDP
jgi:hypothetical protein